MYVQYVLNISFLAWILLRTTMVVVLLVRAQGRIVVMRVHKGAFAPPPPTVNKCRVQRTATTAPASAGIYRFVQNIEKKLKTIVYWVRKSHRIHFGQVIIMVWCAKKNEVNPKYRDTGYKDLILKKKKKRHPKII